MIQVMGRALPLGVTEWNDNWRDQAKPEESDPNFMRQFTTLSLQSLAQGQVAFANQYSIGNGQGDTSPGGHLFLTVNGQGKSQLQAMADMIAQTRQSTSTPSPTTIPVSTTPVSTTTVIPVSTPVLPTATATTGSTASSPNCTVNGQTIQGCTGSMKVNGQACTFVFRNNTVAITCPQKKR